MVWESLEKDRRSEWRKFREKCPSCPQNLRFGSAGATDYATRYGGPLRFPVDVNSAFAVTVDDEFLPSREDPSGSAAERLRFEITEKVGETERKLPSADAFCKALGAQFHKW
eukprot:scaffold1741_cov262-Pinguiococcus_pyrenoidosus.AAC.38